MQKITFFISCKSDIYSLSSGCVKCLESTGMSCSIKNRPEVLYKQAKVALDSYKSLICKHSASLWQRWYTHCGTGNPAYEIGNCIPSSHVNKLAAVLYDGMEFVKQIRPQVFL